MPRRLLSARESLAWAASFAFISAILVLIHFTSVDPDSALYASLSQRLSELPVSRWIAPEWWGNWNSTGLFREHPVGVFLIPTLLGRLGIPAEQAPYVVGVAAGIATLLLIGALVARLTSPEDGRTVLTLLQLMPVVSIFRIRANHEYPMLVCLLLTIAGLDGVRRSWGWMALVVIGLTFGLLVKGVFVILIFAAAAAWILINPTRASGSAWRPIVACLVAVGVMAVVAVAYDAWYLRVTGETFWLPYWRRQLGPVTIATPVSETSTFAGHVAFYLSRLLWHPAPWSLVLPVVVWRYRRDWPTRWRLMPQSARRGLVFVLTFAVLSIGVLSPSSRFAERYTFSASFLIGAAGAVLAYRTWPALRTLVQRLEATVPALPVTLWLTLMLLRLVLGPYLPRISQ